VRDTGNLIAIEYMCASQGIDLLAPLKASKPLVEDDRALTPDIEKIRSIMTAGDIITHVEKITGPLLEI